MKILLPLFFLFIVVNLSAQCPASVHVRGQLANCLGTTLTVDSIPGDSYSSIVWYNGNLPVNTVHESPASKDGVTVAGGHGHGSAANQLVPWGLYVYDNGDILVVDVDNSRVQKWTAGATSGVTIAGGNGAGNAANQLNYPLDMAVDANGNIYIADASNHRVQKWAPGATSGVTVAGGNGRGSAANQLNNPTNIALDDKGNLYVCDGMNFRVQKWAPGATSGITVANEGDYGIAFDKAGNMYLVDNIHNRVRKWAPGATIGVTVAGDNGYGSADNQFFGPISICVDNEGNIFVGDYGNERIMKWTPGATSGILVAGGNGQGIGANQFYEPAAIFFDKKGNLYISDGFNYRVQKWTVPTIDRTYTPGTPGTYTAVVTTHSGCTVTSDAVTIHPTVTPAIQITTPATVVQVCSEPVFSATATDGGVNPSFQWQVNGQNVGAGNNQYTDVNVMNGDIVSCILVSSEVCTTSPTAVSNTLAMQIDPLSAPALEVKASNDNSCSGEPVGFTATPGNVSGSFSYQWQVNGMQSGTNSAKFTTKDLSNGDIVACTLTTASHCTLEISNAIAMQIHPSPEIPAGQVFEIGMGKNIKLTPVITGDIKTYVWSPATGLSDTTIRDPVADPLKTTEYELNVTTQDGCTAKGSIKVYVSSELKIPNAFTPGKGSNGRFYILGGPYGSQIEEFAVFNRWGQTMFQAHNVQVNDPTGGWDGYFHGSLASVGTYAYLITMRLPDGSRKIFRGTVMVIR